MHDGQRFQPLLLQGVEKSAPRAAIASAADRDCETICAFSNEFENQAVIPEDGDTLQILFPEIRISVEDGEGNSLSTS
jgi:hypothetical protein